MKSRELRSAVGTLSSVMESVRSVTQIEQIVTDEGFFLVANTSTVGMPFSAAFTGANVRTSFLEKQGMFSTSPSCVAMEDAGYADISVVHVNGIVEHPMCCRAAMMIKLLMVSQVPIPGWAPATGIKVVETHLR